MVIENVTIKGLNGQIDRFDKLSFNKRLTLLTGANGCGKTTILKIIWYLNSPNVERVFEDVEFREIIFKTDKYQLVLYKGKKLRAEYVPLTDSPQREGIVIEEKRNLGRKNRDGVPLARISRGDFFYGIEDINREIRAFKDTSFYFPTFRRFEVSPNEVRGAFRDIAVRLSDLSQRISVDNHRYITSVATDDIEDLILERYTTSSDAALRNRASFMQVVKEIVDKNVEDENSSTIISDIRQEIEKSNKEQEDIFQDFNTFGKIVSKYFLDKRIRIKAPLDMGKDAASTVVSAKKLSAGEKQVLGFLAYNAFSDNAVIVIDEPELSLNVDWQRRLLSDLLEEKTNNQIIAATHSPFMYARYPEYEIMVGENHGE